MDEIREHSDELIVFIDELHTVVGAGGSARGRHGRRQHPQAGAGPRRAAPRRRHHAGGVPPQHREGRRAGAPLPAGAGARAQRRGHRARSCAACGTATRRTTRCGSPTRRCVAAAELSDRYITDRFLPDKAIDLIDQAGARTAAAGRSGRPPTCARWSSEVERLQREKDQAVAAEQYERASTPARRDRRGAGRSWSEARHRRRRRASPRSASPEIAEVVSRATGIPVGPARPRRSATGCCASRTHLHERVVGQDEAVEVVAEAVRRSRAGPGRPGPADRQLPVPRPDRRRQDRAGPGAGGGAVRRRRPDDPARHERVPGAAHRHPAGRLAPRLRRATTRPVS